MGFEGHSGGLPGVCEVLCGFKDRTQGVNYGVSSFGDGTWGGGLLKER